MTEYTIVLADDHTLMREGIRTMIQAVDGFKVIGEAGDGHQLLNLLKKSQPNLVILDISMPGLRGIEAAREIHTTYPQVGILMLSMHKSEELLAQALEAGASGYLVKDETSHELMEAIRQIRNGRTFLSPTLAKHLSTDIISICRGDQCKAADPLTHRERQVLQLIAEGHTDRQIGEMLYISPRTVQRHRYNLRAKLDIKTTADLVKYAIAKGYTSSR
jgi:DNA-binding NarL/FixJ family response regulator